MQQCKKKWKRTWFISSAVHDDEMFLHYVVSRVIYPAYFTFHQCEIKNALSISLHRKSYFGREPIIKAIIVATAWNKISIFYYFQMKFPPLKLTGTYPFITFYFNHEFQTSIQYISLMKWFKKQERFRELVNSHSEHIRLPFLVSLWLTKR